MMIVIPTGTFYFLFNRLRIIAAGDNRYAVSVITGMPV
ncbi:hypothetical protein FLA_5716 [Filimonas lacunae]|nr:hypothetical protein FLA_5716 [Filimonas lacunae]